MNFAKNSPIYNIIAEYRLQKKWTAKAKKIATNSFNIQEKMQLYSDDKYSNYWILRDLLLQADINLDLIKKYLYMRYGGDELAKLILSDLELQDTNKNYKILNAGSGFASDLIEQAFLLPKAKFIGIEFNRKYANLSAKIIQALNLTDRIKIYCADLANAKDIANIKKTEGEFDGIYSNLAILHIKDKNAVYQNISSLMKKNAKFRNEDYTKNSLTDLYFAENKIGCQNLKTPEEMLSIAEQAGFVQSYFKDLTYFWKEYTKQRATLYQNTQTEKSLKKEKFLLDVYSYFNDRSGTGGVFTHIK